jgi:hypothetical protein
MKVTPLNEAPIIPKLTSNQFAFLFALKKDALDPPRDVKKPIIAKTATYPRSISKKSVLFM